MLNMNVAVGFNKNRIEEYYSYTVIISTKKRVKGVQSVVCLDVGGKFENVSKTSAEMFDHSWRAGWLAGWLAGADYKYRGYYV